MGRLQGPTLIVMFPLDLGRPLVFPAATGAAGIVMNEAQARGMVAGSPGEALAECWRSTELARLLGPQRVVALRGEPIDSPPATPEPEYEHQNIPWGTNALLGPALRLAGGSGSLIEAWRLDAERVAQAKAAEIPDAAAAAAALAGCADWRVRVEVFACGVASLRLEFEPSTELLPHLIPAIELLGYAIYGDEHEPPERAGDPRGGVRIEAANGNLNRLRAVLLRHFANRAVSAALIRNPAQPERRQGQVFIRWVQTALIHPMGVPFPSGVDAFLRRHRSRIPLATPPLAVTTEHLAFWDDSWLITAQVTSDAVLARLIYALVVAEVAGSLAIELTQDVDRRLAAMMAGHDTHRQTPDSMRDVRLFAQIAVGLTATWRISAYDVDHAIVASRGRIGNLDLYREHLGEAAANLYALETSVHTETQRATSDSYAFAAFAISILTAIGIGLSIKDVPGFMDAATPLVRGEVFAVDAGLRAGILLVVLATLAAIGQRLWTARTRQRRAAATKVRRRPRRGAQR